MRIDIPLLITKVDSEQRLVEGVATAAVEDRQGDLIPSDVAKSAFESAWSLMGVREQHDPYKAVGKITDWGTDESSGETRVQVYLSASRDGEDTLTKVKEGVLKGFSIGGEAPSWHFEKDMRVIDQLDLVELSLVDVPACPDAVITLWKGAAVSSSSTSSTGPGVQEQVNQVREKLVEALRAAFCGDSWCYVDDFGADWVVFDTSEGYFKVPFTMSGDTYAFGEPEKVTVEATYTSVDSAGSLSAAVAVVQPQTPEAVSAVAPVTLRKAAQVTHHTTEAQVEIEAIRKVFATFSVDEIRSLGLLEKATTSDLISSVQSLISDASSDPSAAAQASAALSVLGDRTPSTSTSSPSSSSSSSDSSSSSSSPSSSDSKGSSPSSPPSTFAAAATGSPVSSAPSSSTGPAPTSTGSTRPSSTGTSTSSKCFGKNADGFLTIDGEIVLVDDHVVKVDAGDGAGGPAAGWADGNAKGNPPMAGSPEPGGANVALSNAPQDISAGLNARMDALIAQGSPAPAQKMAAGFVPNDGTPNDPRAQHLAKLHAVLSEGGKNSILKAFEIEQNDLGDLESDIRDLVKGVLSKSGVTMDQYGQPYHMRIAR